MRVFGRFLILGTVMAVASLAAGQPIAPSPYWKNQVAFPDDAFREPPFSSFETGWVKFTILTSSPAIVYFQDSRQYKFHYDFATALLDPFIGMTRAQFDAVALHAAGQQAILGAVVMPPQQSGSSSVPQIMEYGIQFVRRDPYTREEIRDLFNLVKANVVTSPGVEAFYFPTFEQMTVAEVNFDWFQAQGIPIGSTDRWAEGNECYSEGWTLGELKFVAGDQIQSAFRSGSLKPDHVLLTDAVPAEIPILAGVITLSPSTPNSHVAILANSWAVPFVYLRETDDATRALQLVGHAVFVSVAKDRQGLSEVRLVDLEGQIDEATMAEILAYKAPSPIQLQPMAHLGAYSTSTEGLSPDRINYVGGKAANFGILRGAIPNHCPVATAFSFDLWNEFLAQTLGTGNTLRAEIAARLDKHTYPPADMAALADDLAVIRALFTNATVTTFSPLLRDAVIATLEDPRYGFDSYRKIRFRSSTNVEDSEHFTGAGLYDSFSGCLADDQDGDTAGPCRCDASDANERGVFRAIRKVFASFYNDTAFLERLRHGVDEDQVGMALLVHHSFPDDIELANGVATVDRRSIMTGFVHDITMVTQDGAASVANPTEDAIPEEVQIEVDVTGTVGAPKLVCASNLVPLGATVLDWPDEYDELARLLLLVSDEYHRVTGKTACLLDLEYKKIAPTGDLVIKQVREIPWPATTASVTAFLINDPVEYTNEQAGPNVFANHRLKSRWRFETKNLPLSTDALGQTFYGDVQLEYAADGRIQTFQGPFASWSDACHEYTTGSFRWPSYRYSIADGWRFPHLSIPRTFELETWGVVTQVAAGESPLLTQRDFTRGRPFRAEYSRSLPEIVYLDESHAQLSTTRVDEVWLYPPRPPQPDDVGQVRMFHDTENGTSITTLFFWPGGISLAYPLLRFERTTLEGFTREPIVLRDYFSQTYGTGRHNWLECFLFEPRLEPGISPDILDELLEKDICLILLYHGPEEKYIQTFGFDACMCTAQPSWMRYR